MKTSLEEKLKLSIASGLGAAVISMTPLRAYISAAIGPQESVMIGLMAFLGTFGGLAGMEIIGM